MLRDKIKKYLKEATIDSGSMSYIAPFSPTLRNFKRSELDPFNIPLSHKNSPDQKSARNKKKKEIEELLSEDLGVWFGTKKKPKGSKQPKGPWVNICRKNKDGKHPPCGREEGTSKGYPKCRAAGVAGKMSDSEKKSACAQKRRAEKKNPKVGKGNKPTMTSYKPKKKKNESLREIIKQILKEETKNKKSNCDKGYPSLWVIINSIINNIEGGYYHPIMRRKNPQKYKNMGGSGETLFGIDRKFAGKDLENMSEWRRFWSLVDQDKKNNPRKWVHNYSLKDNPNLKKELKDLVILLIKNRFRNFSNKFLSNKTKELIKCDTYIIYQMVYASYNGYGFFQKLSNKLNELVENNKGIDDLNWAIRQWRENYPNKIINQSAPKINSAALELSKTISRTNEPTFGR